MTAALLLPCKMQTDMQTETEILPFTFIVQSLRIFGQAFFGIADTGADG